jgi:ABC-type nitrate/sulfonate/bicarbonate transport system substrate-binding protein
MMPRGRHLAPALLALLLLGGGAGGGTPPAWAQQPAKLAMGIPVKPPFLSIITPTLAQEAGFFAEEGLDVDIAGFQLGGVQALKAGIAESLDLAEASGSEIVVAIGRGAPIRILYSYAPKLSGVFLVQGQKIKTCADLRGKRIGIQEIGGFSEVHSRAVLATCGLTPKEVDYVTVSVAGRIPGLLADQIDTAVVHPDQALAGQKARPSLQILVRLVDLYPDFWWTGFVASEKTLATKRDLLVRAVRAMVRASRSFYQNKERTLEVAARNSRFDRDTLSQTYDFLAGNKLMAQNAGIPRQAIEFTIQKMIELGNLPAGTQVPYEKAVDSSVAQEALAKLGAVPGVE